MGMRLTLFPIVCFGPSLMLNLPVPSANVNCGVMYTGRDTMLCEYRNRKKGERDEEERNEERERRERKGERGRREERKKGGNEKRVKERKKQGGGNGCVGGRGREAQKGGGEETEMERKGVGMIENREGGEKGHRAKGTGKHSDNGNGKDRFLFLWSTKLTVENQSDKTAA